MKYFKYINNKKGSNIIAYILVIILVVTISKSLIPLFDSTFKEKDKIIKNMFNSTDTKVVE